MTGLTANTELVVCSAETLATHPELLTDKSEVLLMKDKLPSVIAQRFEEIVAPMNRHNRRLFQAAGGGLGVTLVHGYGRGSLLRSLGTDDRRCHLEDRSCRSNSIPRADATFHVSGIE